MTNEKVINSEAAQLSKIGQNIRKYRAQRGITRESLANKSNISLRYLAQIESGKGNPTLIVLKNISNAMNMTLKNLLYDEYINDSNKESIIEKLDQFNTKNLKNLLAYINEIEISTEKKKNKKKIALIGLRGAGKSTLGSLYSKVYNVPCYEITNELEKKSGMNVSEILELGGQSMYRRLEYDVINVLSKKHKKIIILTGGSIVSERQTCDFLLKNFFTIWIKASPKEHMSRVVKQGDLRPISSNPKAMKDLKNILKEREKLYMKADTIINTENKNRDESFEELEKEILK